MVPVNDTAVVDPVFEHVKLPVVKVQVPVTEEPQLVRTAIEIKQTETDKSDKFFMIFPQKGV